MVVLLLPAHVLVALLTALSAQFNSARAALRLHNKRFLIGYWYIMRLAYYAFGILFVWHNMR